MGFCPEVVPYPTPKYARIKNAKLGLLRYALYFLVFMYVAVYNVMYLGTHLGHGALQPTYQVQVTNPTKDHCDPLDPECHQDFTSLSVQPYCMESKLPFDGFKLPCEMWDRSKLNQVINSGVLIPTHVTHYWQKPGCHPSAANNFSCNGYVEEFLDYKGDVQTAPHSRVTPVKDFYISDIDRSTLLVDHSVDFEGFRSYSQDMQGYWMDCNHGPCKPKPIGCGVGKKCKIDTGELDASSLNPTDGARGARRSLTLLDESSRAEPEKRKSFLEPSPLTPEAPDEASLAEADIPFYRAPWQPTKNSTYASKLDNDGMISIHGGDVFLIGKLLDMANMSLDDRRPHFKEVDFPGVKETTGSTFRSSGFILVVRVFYTNDESWIGLKVFPWQMWGPNIHYIYSVTKHSANEDYFLSKVRTMNQATQQQVLKYYHGIGVIVEQTGSITIWDNIQFIVITCYVLALVAASNFITDTVALHYMAKSPEYTAIKYQRPVANKRRKQEDYHDSDVEHPDSEPEDNILRYSSMTM